MQTAAATEQATAPVPAVLPPEGAWSITTFCKAHSCSRAWLYSLWAVGKGPPKCRVQGKIILPKAGARDWLDAHQEQAAA